MGCQNKSAPYADPPVDLLRTRLRDCLPGSVALLVLTPLLRGNSLSGLPQHQGQHGACTGATQCAAGNGDCPAAVREVID